MGYWPSKNASGDSNVIGEFVSLAKPIVLCTIRNRILCLWIFALEPIADFCLFLGYSPSKNGSRDHDVKGEFVSPAKAMVFGTVGEIILFRLFLPK